MVSEGGDGPESRLGYLLKHALFRYTRLNDDALAALGIDGRELGILFAVADGEPRSQQEIAARLDVDRTTMVAMLDGLESKGIVTRRPHPDDRRRNVVVMTDDGSRLLTRAREVSDKVERRFFASLSTTEARTFRAALSAVVADAG